MLRNIHQEGLCHVHVLKITAVSKCNSDGALSCIQQPQRTKKGREHVDHADEEALT